MPTIPVVGYGLAWNSKTNSGEVILKLQSNQEVRLPAANGGDFAAMAAVLNESPVFYSSETGGLRTQWEPIGGTG